MVETMSYSPLWFQHISIKVNLSLLHGLAYMYLALSDPTISSFSTIFYSKKSNSKIKVTYALMFVIWGHQQISYVQRPQKGLSLVSELVISADQLCWGLLLSNQTRQALQSPGKEMSPDLRDPSQTCILCGGRTIPPAGVNFGLSIWFLGFLGFPCIIADFERLFYVLWEVGYCQSAQFDIMNCCAVQEWD